MANWINSNVTRLIQLELTLSKEDVTTEPYTTTQQSFAARKFSCCRVHCFSISSEIQSWCLSSCSSHSTSANVIICKLASASFALQPHSTRNLRMTMLFRNSCSPPVAAVHFTNIDNIVKWRWRGWRRRFFLSIKIPSWSLYRCCTLVSSYHEIQDRSNSYDCYDKWRINVRMEWIKKSKDFA